MDGTSRNGAAESAKGDASVLVVDDQQLFRDVMRAVIEATPGLELVAEASSGEEALTIVDELLPDLAIVDVRMPGMGGVDLACALFERPVAPMVILVSAQAPPTILPTAPDGRAVLFLAKERLRPATLLKAWTDHSCGSPPDHVA